MNNGNCITRVGVFYDGNYFANVSKYYHYRHQRRAWISLQGLHDFIQNYISEKEVVHGVAVRVVHAHYFRGRFMNIDNTETIKAERRFDNALMCAGVVQHYLPMTDHGEKGVDVSLALEAFELALCQRLDIAVFVVCDGDYIPLMKKLHILGVKTMVLGWNLDCTNDNTDYHPTRTSQFLLDAVEYPISMNALIDDRTKQKDIDALFFSPTQPQSSVKYEYKYAHNNDALKTEVSDNAHSNEEKHYGTIHRLVRERRYGFIKQNALEQEVFFFCNELQNKGYSELNVGEKVEYYLGKSDNGKPCANNVTVLKE